MATKRNGSKSISAYCPHCKSNHDYRVDVEYSAAFDPRVEGSYADKTLKEDVRRTFFCKKNNAEFEGVISISRRDGLRNVGEPQLR